MRRATLLTAVLVLALAAPAAAWVELPPYEIPGGGIADCLRAAGPGQVALLGRLGRTTSATDLFAVGPRGTARVSTTTLGWLDRCAEVATADGAPPLLAGVVEDQHGSGEAIGVAGAGGAPTIVGRDVGPALFSPSVATTAGGASVVAWIVVRFPTRARALPQARVLAAVRPAAGVPFGPASVLDTHVSPVTAPVAGIDASGRATVAWLDDVGPRRRATSVVRVASAPPGGPFAASQRLAPATDEALALAVAANGRALIAFQDLDAIDAFERQPGGVGFARVPLPAARGIARPAVALNDDGGAAIAYRTAPRSTSALLRPPGRGFTRSGPAAPAGGSSSSVGFSISDSSAPVPPSDPSGAALATALSPDGGLAIAWGGEASRGSARPAYAVHGTLAAGLGRRHRLGSPCRSVNAAQPVTLADGTLGVAWTDNTRVDSLFADDPRLGGRLHIALPGRASALPAPAPQLVARLLGPAPHRPTLQLRIRVGCRHGACEVRASTTARFQYRARGRHTRWFPLPLSSARALAAGHSAVLRLTVPVRSADARVQLAPTVTVIACAPGSPAARRVALHIGARRRARR